MGDRYLLCEESLAPPFISFIVMDGICEEIWQNRQGKSCFKKSNKRRGGSGVQFAESCKYSKCHIVQAILGWIPKQILAGLLGNCFSVRIFKFKPPYKNYHVASAVSFFIALFGSIFIFLNEQWRKGVIPLKVDQKRSFVKRLNLK